MTVRFGFCAIVLLLACGPVVAQTNPYEGIAPAAAPRQAAPQRQPVAGPRQPIYPQQAPATQPHPAAPQPRQAPPQRQPVAGPRQPVYPQQAPATQPHPAAPQPRPAAPQPARAPFVLTPQQQTYLDWVLQNWEKQSSRVKTFECQFVRWEYDAVFGDPDKPKYEDKGKLKYAAPDRGLFEIVGEREERWISDGKSIFEYNHAKKQLIQHKLPPELQGKAISNGPLPFLFGAKADELKQRYFMRVITPADRHKLGEVWLEAYPRFRADAANFRRAELILKSKGMTPHALQVYDPGGKSHTAYQFYDIVTNDPLQQFFRINPFIATTPFGWKKIVEEPPAPPAPRVTRQPPSGPPR